MLKYTVFAILNAFTLVNCDIIYLPKNVKPLRYIITTEPDLTNVGWNPSQFWGDVTIQFQALERTKNITLHAVELEIDAATIKVVGNYEEVLVKSTASNKQHQMYIINLEQPLHVHHYYNLTIGRFSGTYTLNKRGLYKAIYGPYNKTIAVTLFDPAFARYAFPCFDEPQLKARFIINLIRSKGYNSVSNEDLERTEKLDENRFKDVFKETPLMSTYTVAFVISDFNFTERKERHRIYAQQSAFEKNELQLPLDVSVKTLKILEEYFGIDYTLSKIDSFAMPRGCFEPFAMENWGLITYREDYIRCTNTTDYSNLRRTTIYIAHEFAHQWFGNLVTPVSWDYIWLSESFAAYFHYFIASKIRPSWRLMDQFVIEIVQESFHNEETLGSHGLNYKINRNGDLPPFHILSKKGCAIVWMMSNFLTADLFRKALHNYLLDRQFQNVVPRDLYRIVQKTVDENNANHLLGNMTFSEILGTWDTFDGYPSIKVARDYVTGNVVLTQETELSLKGHIWKIPVNYVSSDNKINFEDTKADFWMVDENASFKVGTKGWLILNKKHSGYYRVNYDKENWDRIIQTLKSDDFEKIHVLNRAQLLYDAFYFAENGKLSVDIPFRLAEYLVRERDYIAFLALYNSMSKYCHIYKGVAMQAEINYFLNHPLRNSTSHTTSKYLVHYTVFREYIRTIMSNIRQHLGKESKPNEPVLDGVNRIEIDYYFRYYFQ